MFGIGVTDIAWFEFLREENITEYINFWAPTQWNVRKFSQGDYFFFMLKSPIRKLGGYGRFVEYKNVSTKDAWNEFGRANGVSSYNKFKEKLNEYNDGVANIGAIVLTECIYFEEENYIDIDDYGIDFKKSIVKFKYFPEDSIVETLLKASSSGVKSEIILNEGSPEYESSKVKIREGQSEFRNKLLRAYDGKCCITGDSCRELLEAAHIQEYININSNHIQNGLLMRCDFHKLFDNGLLYVDESYIIHISDLVKSDYYHRYDGMKINLPRGGGSIPSLQALRAKRDEFRQPNIRNS